MNPDNKDSRNVADKYKGWMEDLIKEDLNRQSFPFSVCFENWIGDFNMATGIRNANAFGVRQVYYLGNRRWDRRGAVGTHNYTNVKFLEDSAQGLLDLSRTHTIIGVDNVVGSVPITDFVWPDNTLMIFGEEGQGLSPVAQAACTALVEIPMYGSVRSLNCGTASGILMHDFVTKYNRKKNV